jgi:hypothetical protein
MRGAFALLAALALGACHGGAATPSTVLTRALAAVRAGNRDDFVKAMNDADAAKTGLAWQEGMPRCAVTMTGLQIYGEAMLVDQMNQPDIFKLSEEARFVYAAKVAGQYDAAIAGISMNPMVHDFYTIDPTRHWVSCPEAAFSAGIGYEQGPLGESERRAAFQDWIDALKARHPGAQFDTAMNNAVAELDRHNYTAAWPGKFQIEDDPNMRTFGAVRRNAGGHGDYGDEE